MAISTVSDDESKHQVISSLQFALWKVNSWTLPVSFAVPDMPEANRSSDILHPDHQSRQATIPVEESEFQQVFNNYCNKYIQLCTRIEYAV